MSVLMKNGNNYTGSTNSGGGGATNLNGLSDVEVSSPSDGQVLSYDSSTAKWENSGVPIASANAVGGIKVGQNLSIQSDGTLNASGGGGGSSYSTSEQVIGTWIDGSTLYQKTINFGYGPSTAKQVKSVNHGISNISRVVDIRCVYQYGSGSTALGSLVACVVNPTWYDNINNTGTIVCYLYQHQVHIIGSTSLSNDYFYVTLQYTKTS